MTLFSEDVILRLTERVEIAVTVGESHFREFKSALQGLPDAKGPRDIDLVARDIGETLVAFANADGGELLVGVEDDGTVTGVPFPQEVVARLLSAPNSRVHKDTPLPTCRAVPVPCKGLTVLYFAVPKGTQFIHLTSDGRCLQRRDRETVPIASEQITSSRAEIASREYDRAFVENATVEDLDSSLITNVATQISKGMSPEKCLQHLELAEFDGTRLRLRKAALLLFAKQPHKWHPRLQVRIVRVDGTELKSGEQFNVLTDEETTNNILTLIESSWDLLRPHLTETRFSKEAIFRTQIVYPELACREALINAIAHRDYNIEGRGVEVRVYADRLEIISPGGLLSSIRLEDLKSQKGVHQSRNSLVARVLREAGYMRELGEGMRRIYELMHTNDLSPPDIVSDGNMFSIALHQKYIYSREEKLWLDGFAAFNLSRQQKTIVRLGYNNHVISPAEIFKAVGLVDTEEYRKLIVSLRSMGILYRSVAKGAVDRILKREKKKKKSIPQFSIRTPAEIIARATTAVSASPPAPLDTNQKAESRDLDDNEYARVYVGNIPYDADEFELMELFSKFGEVVEVEISVDRAVGRPRGFCFVEFRDGESARTAVVHTQKLFLAGRILTIQPATPRHSDGRKY